MGRDGVWEDGEVEGGWQAVTSASTTESGAVSALIERLCAGESMRGQLDVLHAVLALAAEDASVLWYMCAMPQGCDALLSCCSGGINFLIELSERGAFDAWETLVALQATALQVVAECIRIPEARERLLAAGCIDALNACLVVRHCGPDEKPRSDDAEHLVAPLPVQRAAVDILRRLGAPLHDKMAVTAAKLLGSPYSEIRSRARAKPSDDEAHRQDRRGVRVASAAENAAETEQDALMRRIGAMQRLGQEPQQRRPETRNADANTSSPTSGGGCDDTASSSSHDDDDSLTLDDYMRPLEQQKSQLEDARGGLGQQQVLREQDRRLGPGHGQQGQDTSLRSRDSSDHSLEGEVQQRKTVAPPSTSALHRELGADMYDVTINPAADIAAGDAGGVHVPAVPYGREERQLSMQLLEEKQEAIVRSIEALQQQLGRVHPDDATGDLRHRLSEAEKEEQEESDRDEEPDSHRRPEAGDMVEEAASNDEDDCALDEEVARHAGRDARATADATSTTTMRAMDKAAVADVDTCGGAREQLAVRRHRAPEQTSGGGRSGGRSVGYELTRHRMFSRSIVPIQSEEATFQTESGDRALVASDHVVVPAPTSATAPALQRVASGLRALFEAWRGFAHVSSSARSILERMSAASVRALAIRTFGAWKSALPPLARRRRFRRIKQSTALPWTTATQGGAPPQEAKLAEARPSYEQGSDGLAVRDTLLRPQWMRTASMETPDPNPVSTSPAWYRTAVLSTSTGSMGRARRASFGTSPPPTGVSRIAIWNAHDETEAEAEAEAATPIAMQLEEEVKEVVDSAVRRLQATLEKSVAGDGVDAKDVGVADESNEISEDVHTLPAPVAAESAHDPDRQLKSGEVDAARSRAALHDLHMVKQRLQREAAEARASADTDAANARAALHNLQMVEQRLRREADEARDMYGELLEMHRETIESAAVLGQHMNARARAARYHPVTGDEDGYYKSLALLDNLLARSGVAI